MRSPRKFWSDQAALLSDGPRACADARAHALDQRLKMRRIERLREPRLPHRTVAVTRAARADVEHLRAGEALDPEIGRPRPRPSLEPVPVGQPIVRIVLVEKDDGRKSRAIRELVDLGPAGDRHLRRVRKLAVAGG